MKEKMETMRNCFKVIAFFATLLFLEMSSIEHNHNHFEFCEKNKQIGFLEKKFYTRAVALLPIVCIDIIIYNPTTQCYLLILRNNPPAQNRWWVPGGRLFKGESFFEAAMRKCKEELNILIEPQKILGIYSTIFPDSAWGCSTHTVNVVIFALYDDTQIIHLDTDHNAYKWQLLSSPHDNPYTNAIRKKALKHLRLLKKNEKPDIN